MLSWQKQMAKESLQGIANLHQGPLAHQVVAMVRPHQVWAPGAADSAPNVSQGFMCLYTPFHIVNMPCLQGTAGMTVPLAC